MDQHSSRRDFLKVSVGAACVAPLASLDPAAASLAGAATGVNVTAGHIKKALQIEMLPKNLSYADRFKLVRDVGFEAVEGQTVTDQKEAEEVKRPRTTPRSASIRS